jgi:DNA-directed RNA polymerase beta subunit/DNA-directed RNA polymerase beta' subunit
MTALTENVIKQISDQFATFKSRNRSLELKRIWAEDNLDPNDLASQVQAKDNEQTWGIPIKATVQLMDTLTKEPVGKPSTIQVMKLPKMTSRFSFIVDGGEYQVDHLLKLRSGVYTKVRRNGDLASEFMLRKGGHKNFSLELDRKKSLIQFKPTRGSSHIPVYPLMKVMGVSDDEMERTWGSAVFQANRIQSDEGVEKTLRKFYEKTGGEAKTPTMEEVRNHVYTYFDDTELLPETTKFTLGQPFSKVSGGAMLAAAHKLIKLERKEVEPDDRDSLLFKEAVHVEDFIPEKLFKSRTRIFTKVRNTLSHKTSPSEILQGGELFNRPIKEFFTQGGNVSERSEQTNPVQMLSGNFKTTLIAKDFGGMKDADKLGDEMRMVNPSHFGFLDPLHTPESERTGITLHLGSGVRKEGNELKAPVYDLKLGKHRTASVPEFHMSTVALPDQVNWVGGKPVPIADMVKMKMPGGDIEKRPFKEATFVMPTAKGMLSYASNLIPFLPCDQGNRASMADKQMEQAISLKHREAPLVQSLVHQKDPTHTFEKMIGTAFAAHRAPVAGHVTKITGDAIHVHDGKTEHTVHIYNNFPLNDPTTMMHSTPTVKVGDEVKAGQLVADSNFTKNGTLALGTNLRIGYLPYKGYNFEDGVVISETAAQKMTSEHLHKLRLDVDPQEDRTSKATWKAHSSKKAAVMTKEQWHSLDEDGVIKPGTRVISGQVLATCLTPNLEKSLEMVKRFGSKSVKPWKDKSLTWDEDYVGVVTRVVKSPNGKAVKVFVKTEEPAEIGDKLSGRHGNKGIITKILPDEEMPFTKHGDEKRPLEVLLNPSGVPCYDEETEFLTTCGWVKAPEISESDVFATINLVTFDLEFQKPEEIYKIPYKGKMYRIENQQLDLLVTPNHKMLTAPRCDASRGSPDIDDESFRRSFTLEQAENIAGQARRYLKTARWKGEDPKFFHIEAGEKAVTGQPMFGFNFYSKDWAEFMGWFLSEGSTYETSGYRYVTEISQDKNANPEKYARIAVLLDRMGVRHSQAPNGFQIFHKGLYEHLKPLGKCHEKYVSRDILDLPPTHLKILLDAYLAGDGYEYVCEETGHFGTLRVTTVSKALADGLQEIAVKLGMTANVKEEQGVERLAKYKNGKCYLLNLSGRCVAPWANWSETTKLNQIEEWVPYDGTVYCATVPNATLFVRRNGKPVWSGNTRMNVGQVLETAAAKIAEKTGQTYVVNNFAGSGHNYRNQVINDLKKHGLTDEELVYDPSDTRRALGSVLVGPQHILKLKHQVEKKLVVRGGGSDLNERPYGYDPDHQPVRGGAHGGQGFGALELYSLLGHNARANLREMTSYKADQQNEDFWRMIQEGHEPRAPQVSFAYTKFEGLLKGLGVDVQKSGSSIRMIPMSDAEVKKLGGRNELQNPGLVVSKTMKPEKGGLFDPLLTGVNGDRWSYFTLSEPLPNPLFVGDKQNKGPIPALLSLKHGDVSVEDIDAIVTGKKMLNGKVGGIAIRDALRDINVDASIKEIREELLSKRGNKKDQANRTLKYLLALKEQGKSPADSYVLSHVPVLPPMYRPLTATNYGDVAKSPLNDLYRNMMVVNEKLKAMPVEKFGHEPTADLRSNIWNSFKALQAVGDYKPVYDPDSHEERQLSGIVDIIGSGGAEGQPKEGYFQAKLVKRKQDLSIRSTIVPEPSLHIDEVGLPKHAAMELYKPFVIAHMHTKFGYRPDEALSHMQRYTDQASKALDDVMKDRPLLLKRDPALHKFSVMAFRPKAVEGKAIKIHPLVTGGFNADFDGDQMLGSVFVYLSEDIVSDLKSCNTSVSVEGYLWWYLRRAGGDMAARLREKVGIAVGGEFFLVNLEDFPHEGEPQVKDHIEFFKVPPGIQVVSYDESYGRLVLAKVSHWSRHKDRKVEIVNLASGRQIISDDDPRAVYGVNRDLAFERARPADAIGMFVPVAHTFDLADGNGPIEVFLPAGDPRLKPVTALDGRLGRLLGTLVGDGWVVTNAGQLKGQVALAAAENSIRDGFISDLLAVFEEAPTVTPYERLGGDFGDDVRSCKYVVSSMAFSKFVEPLIGKKADQKHLPPFFLSAPKPFRLGLLAGLIDTDGSISVSNAKAKPQWMISFATRSIRLAQEFVYLTKSLAIRATITPSKTPGGEKMWAVGISIVDFHKLQELPLADVHKRTLFAQFFKDAPPEQKNSYAQKDVIPTPPKLAAWMRQQIGTSLGQSIYVVLSNAMERGYMSRYTAREILASMAGRLPSHMERWAWMVDNDHVWWDRVVDYEVTEQTETGFDLTVPGFETFMSVDGLVLSNTMAGTVPISREAVEEAKKMFPSKNLFSPTTYGAMHVPNQEFMLGLHLISKWGKDTGKSFNTIGEMKKAHGKGEIEMTDVASLGGKPTTLGRALIAEGLPPKLESLPKILRDPAFVVTSGTLREMVREVAKGHAAHFDSAVNHLKDLGTDQSFKQGFSLGLKDFAPLPERDKIVAEHQKKADHISATEKDHVKRDEKLVDLWTGATAQIMSALEARKGETRLSTMVYSGARGKKDQYRQMVAAPMLVQDSSNRTVPTPVLGSYGEGLDVGDYWLSQHGARKGTLQRSSGTREPGAMTKDIINSTISTLITSDDCKTNHGISLSLEHQDIHDRYLASAYGQHKAGTLLTPTVVNDLKKLVGPKKSVQVRSPLRCQHGEGICAKCFGLNENGKLHPVGTNIGVLAGQALGEPATQLAMDAFHSGGIAAGRGGSSVSKIERLKQLLRMPKTLRGSAVLSTQEGAIQAITPNVGLGGHDVVIGGITHHVREGEKHDDLAVGGLVRRGQSLSKDIHPVHPKELLGITKDVREVQRYLTDELYNKLYQGENVRQRNVELVVRSLTNYTKVKDPGHSHWEVGDVVPHSIVEEHNRDLKGANSKPVLHEPILEGSNTIPRLSENWMARLNYQRLGETIQRAAGMGWKSDLHGSHPIPGIAYGKEFGKPTSDVSPKKSKFVY